MLPDFSEYNWVIPDFVWELSEQIDLGECFFLWVWRVHFTNSGQPMLNEVKAVDSSSSYLYMWSLRQTSQSFTRDGGNSQTSTRP